MNIVPAFLPSLNAQPRVNELIDKENTAREVFPELVEESLSVPVSAIVESEGTSQQFESQQRFFDRLDLRSLRDEELTLNQQRALESYQTVAGNSPADDGGIARLDIIV